MKTCILLVVCLLFILNSSSAQDTSNAASLLKLPAKYISGINSKIDKYSNGILKKTEKTLEKLCRWENKIKGMLKKISPETEQRLFGNTQLTFSGMLQKIKEGKTVAESYMAKYDQYRDELAAQLQFITKQEGLLRDDAKQTAEKIKGKLADLDSMLQDTDALENMIKQRKKVLLAECTRYISKSKYLDKISKETWYYIETVKNYKEIFSSPGKAEETMLQALNKLPFFKEFMENNLNTLPASLPFTAANPSLAGLQTITAVQNALQQQFISNTGNPGILRTNIQTAQAQLNALKERLSNTGGSNDDLPDFKPNNQKTKKLLQRIEYGANIQFSKGTSAMPQSSEIAVSIGYKLNSKSVAGIGVSYRVGIGSVEHINIKSEGAGLRSFVDLKMKGSFWLSGGYEMNYNRPFISINQLRNSNTWQSSGLLGISKKIRINSKWLKESKLQLLYDFTAGQHKPASQPLLFRIGYTF
jgi:hypothetical protein